MNEQRHKSDRLSIETRAEVQRLDHRVKLALLVVSCTTIVLLIAAALSENVFARWRLFRRGYDRVLAIQATDDLGRHIAAAFDLEIDQLVLPGHGVVDRCITCHTGVDDPRMRDVAQPFATHPGRYLEVHEPAKFGCTVCHEGQGRATTVEAAHGRAPFWDYPLLERPYMKSGCSKCHSADELFGTERLVEQLDDDDEVSVSTRRLDLGWRLVEAHGCLGCHAIDGKGGNLGPDLTRVGAKTPHEFSFAHVDDHRSRRVSVWLREHFLDPQAVSPGSLMPNVGLNDEEAEALTAVMLSLRPPGPDAGRMAGHYTLDEPGGGRLYAMYCSGCHAHDGTGSAAPGILTPSLRNDDVLAVAHDDYLRLITASGRAGTHMPGWAEQRGGLSADEINRIVEHLRSWETAAARAADVRAELGDAEIGGTYFQSLCANCHGFDGEGGIGNSLNTQAFQAIASDRFLAETIIEGRPGTAMPSWKYLPTQAVADLLAYLRRWRATPADFDDVRRIMQEQPRGSRISAGRQLYGLHCASCHGNRGEGGIGLNLRTPSFLRVVDDRFLFDTIVNGRPTTAMPAWQHLSAQDITSIISFLRSWQSDETTRLQTPGTAGDHVSGEAHYRISCRQCHGENGGGGVGPQLTNPVLLATANDAQLLHWIGHGRTGTAMKGFLPGEQGPTTLTATQITDVIAYLRSVARREETPLLQLGAGDPWVGAQLFRGSCAACHGSAGEGTSGPQLRNRSFLRAASDGFLAGTIVMGREGTPMRSMVHGQQGLGQIAPEQVQDLIAYMRLWEAETWQQSRLAVEMSDRAIEAGRASFAGYCAGCHGPRGRGVQDGPDYYAPALNNQDFLRAASDGFLLATIARGRRGTPMRPFGAGAGGIVSLPSTEISDIVSYLRSWQESSAQAGGTNP